MSERVFQITLPDSASQDIEHRLNSRIAGQTLFWQDFIIYSGADEEQAKHSLDVIAQFADETLWAILDYRVPYPQRQRRRALIAKTHRSQAEESELDHLMATYDRFILVRSQALLALKQRGYDMDQYLKDQNL